MVPETLTRSPEVLARFWAKVDKRGPDECWEWTAARHDRGGYGLINIGGRVARANRIALEQKLGRPLGPSMKARHSCDNPPCCNPAHLLEGTQADNVADMHSRGRRVYARKPMMPKPPAKQPAGRFSNATHCVHGHEFTPENTWMKPNNKVRGGLERVCITCRKRINKEQAAKRKAERHLRGLRTPGRKATHG